MKNSNATSIVVLCIILLMMAGTVAFYGTIAYIVMHFIHKLW